MTSYQDGLARFLARSGALFFAPGLKLKDGRPTPYFVNLGRINTGRTGLELAGYLSRMLVEEGLIKDKGVLIGPSYKGSALAALTAAGLWAEFGLEAGFDYDRKEAKGHGEASGQKTLFVTGALAEASEAVVIDDVATSMATKVELVDKIRAERPDLEIRAVVVVVDREQSQPVYDDQGRVRLGVRGQDAVQAFVDKTGLPVLAAAPIRAVVERLYQDQVPVRVGDEMRPLGGKEKKEFYEYLTLYGR